MNLPAALDVAIGMVVLYFLLSTVCSFAVELIATYRWWRKRILYEAIARMLTGNQEFEAPKAPVLPESLSKWRKKPPQKTDTVSDQVIKDQVIEDFWKHPLARNLAPEGQLPSYLAPGTFAAIVVNLSVPGASSGTLPATANGVKRVLELSTRSGPEVMRPLREQLVMILQTRSLTSTAPDAGKPQSGTEPLRELLDGIESWYNEVMNRLGGQYKRKAQAWLFLTGLATATLFNADTIRAIYVLGTDSAVRSTVAAYGAAIASPPQPAQSPVPSSPAPAASNAVLNISGGAVLSSAAGSNLFSLHWTNEVQTALLRSNLVMSLKDLQRLQQAGFPLGWRGDSVVNFAPCGTSPFPTLNSFLNGAIVLLLKLSGLVATALAISLGAPFWFDLLNKLVNLRGSGSAGPPARAPSDKPQPSLPGGQGNNIGPGGGAAPVVPTSITPTDFNKDLCDARLGFNVRKAYWSAEAAWLAYAAEGPVRSAIQQWSMDLALLFEKTEASQGFLAVAKDKKVALLTFRGTEQKLEDWQTDAEFKLVRSPTGAGNTHEGFTTQLEKVYPEITDALKKHLANDTLLYVAGHSLGGALATLMAARIATDKVCGIHAVHTFGSPRVGDNEFGKAYELALGHCTYRVVNAEDLVTRVPPRVIPGTDWRYDHVGQVVYFDSDGRMQLNVGFWERFLNTVINAVQDFRAAIKTSLKDHSMEGYVRLLKQKVNS